MNDPYVFKLCIYIFLKRGLNKKIIKKLIKKLIKHIFLLTFIQSYSLFCYQLRKGLTMGKQSPKTPASSEQKLATKKTRRKRCPHCKHLMRLGSEAGSQTVKPRKINAYASFVQTMMKTAGVKAVARHERMRHIASLWKAKKQSKQ